MGNFKILKTVGEPLFKVIISQTFSLDCPFKIKSPFNNTNCITSVVDVNFLWAHGGSVDYTVYSI
jgi:hypothetical protein